MEDSDAGEERKEGMYRERENEECRAKGGQRRGQGIKQREKTVKNEEIKKNINRKVI